MGQIATELSRSHRRYAVGPATQHALPAPRHPDQASMLDMSP